MGGWGWRKVDEKVNKIAAGNAGMPGCTIGGRDEFVIGEIQVARFLPAGEVLEDLEKKAAEYDRLANEMREPGAAGLRKLAEICRGRFISLKYGRWTS